MAASPPSPSFSAAHMPSMRFRRAFALKRSSSSCANFFSKPSSRLSNVVMVPRPRCVDVENLALHIGRKSTNQHGGTRHFGCHASARCDDCAQGCDPLGCPYGRAGPSSLSRAARSRRRGLFHGVTAHDGFSQDTVYSHEPPTPHL